MHKDLNLQKTCEDKNSLYFSIIVQCFRIERGCAAALNWFWELQRYEGGCPYSDSGVYHVCETRGIHAILLEQ